MATSFLGGAKDRLLPASIPFRFFLAASLFHIAAWATLLVAAADLPGFTGGTGPVLAALHLATLGVFAMTAMGAAYQLLPVVTRAALASTWPARASFWLMAPGVTVLAWGMGVGAGAAMQAGGLLTGTGLTLFAGLTIANLARAGSIAVVAAYGWAALVGLSVLVGLGLVLIWDFEAGFLADHAALARLHLTFALFGFMGLLVGGFSLVLVPMFVLSRSLPPRPAWAGLGFALAGLGLAALGLWWSALVAGSGAAAIHVWLLRKAEKSSMRRRLGAPFVLIRAGRYLLLGTLLLIAAYWAGAPIPNAPALIGFGLVAGWLLTFLMGVLQRIMPFLASMHASGASGLPLLLSDLTAQTPLKIHTFAHFAALAAVAAGIMLDDVVLVRLGAASGLIGALAFAAFAVNVAVKLRAAKQANRAIKRGKRAARKG